MSPLMRMYGAEPEVKCKSEAPCCLISRSNSSNLAIWCRALLGVLNVLLLRGLNGSAFRHINCGELCGRPPAPNRGVFRSRLMSDVSAANQLQLFNITNG